MSQLEREEAALTDDYNAGRLTREEYNKYMRELQRDYQAQAEEAAQEAYEAEMSRW